MFQKQIFHSFTFLALICIAKVGLTETVSGADRPNVLFIAVDDWNDWVGVYGHGQAKTPNLDRLAARGVTFRNAHTSAVYCAPSRTSVMTGLNPHTTGAYTDEPHFASVNHPDLRDLPLWFREHDYYVAGGGKIYHHMPGFIDMRGWDEYFIWNEDLKKKGWGLDSWGDGAPLPEEVPLSPIAKHLLAQEMERFPNKNHERVNSHIEWGPLPNEAEEKMADTICTNWAAEFLRSTETPNGKPFFLGFGLYAPHKPNFVPQKYFRMYSLKDIEQPEMFPGDLDDLPPQLRRKTLARKNYVDTPMRQLMCAKKAVHGYLAAIDVRRCNGRPRARCVGRKPLCRQHDRRFMERQWISPGRERLLGQAHALGTNVKCALYLGRTRDRPRCNHRYNSQSPRHLSDLDRPVRASQESVQ